MINNASLYHPSVISQISHELNIPITGILGMAYFLEQTPLSQQQKKHVQDIVFCANRLLNLEKKLLAILKENKSNIF